MFISWLFFNGILHSQASLSVTFSFLKSAIHLVWSVFGMTHFREMESQTSTTTIIVVLLFLCFLVLSVIMLVNILVALLTATYDKYKVCFNQSSKLYIWSEKKNIIIYLCHYDFTFVFRAAGFKFKFYLESFKWRGILVIFASYCSFSSLSETTAYLLMYVFKFSTYSWPLQQPHARLETA